MRSFDPGRVIAPLALLAVIVAVLLIVRPGGSDDEASTPATSTSTSSRTTRTAARTKAKRRRTYTVRANDTLSAIADRTGLSLQRLQALNPSVEAGALREGQKLKLTG